MNILVAVWAMSVITAFFLGGAFATHLARRDLRLLCPTCHGKGQLFDGDAMPCPTCGVHK